MCLINQFKGNKKTVCIGCFITVIGAFVGFKTGLFRSQRCARKRPLLIHEKGRVLYEGLVGRINFEKQIRLRGKSSSDDIFN